LGEDGPLRTHLQDAGVNCEILPMADRARNIRRTQVVPHQLPIGAVTDTLRYTFRLHRRLRILRPDLVHANSLKSGVYGCLASRLAGIPVVWHVRDRIDSDYLPQSAVRLMRALIRYLPNAAIANSNATLDTLGDAPRVAVIPSPVISNGAMGHRGTSRYSSEEFLIGMVGRISPWKGQDVFIRAFAEAFRSGNERALIVGCPLFGEDEHEAKLHQLADELGISERVEFAGFCDDIDSVFNALDLMVHASVIPEPFGQVIIEAMAAGVPVVAAGAGGPLEIAGNQEYALLYSPGNVHALARAMRKVRLDDSLRSSLSAKGYARAKDFTPEVVAAQMLKVYRGILGPTRHELQQGTKQRFLEPGIRKQYFKQQIRRLVGDPYVGKRLKLRSASRALDHLNLSPRQILDAGCEDATFVYWLADRFPTAEVVGVDIDGIAISACKGNLPCRYRARVEFLAASFADLPDSSFDLVTVFDVLEHITDDVGALRHLHRALRPGGTLLVHVPRDQWTDYHGCVTRIRDEDAWKVNPGHVRAGYSPARLHALVESAGFQVDETELWLRRWGALAHRVYSRLEHPRPLRAITIPVTDACAILDRFRPPEEGNTVWLVGTA
jgi:glycosyltransferase involved in cell wall biosynthesis/SAM-dependent methyltransferase